MPRINRGFTVLIAALIILGASGMTLAAPDKIAVKAGRIIPVLGEEIEGGIILIDGGKIKAIGKDLEIPYDFWVLDASKLVAFPGMVEPFTSQGLDRANESLPVAPYLDVYDAIDPSSVFFEDALRDGITTVLISQGPDTVIGGIARVVKPIGMTVDTMTVKDDAGIILSFMPKSGTDRMIQMATYRETFRELVEYLGNLAESKYEEKLKKEEKTMDVGPDEAREKGRSLIKAGDLDFKHANLVRLIEGKLRVFAYCQAPVDVVHAMDTAREKGFLQQVVFVLEEECYKAIDLLKAGKRPVILGPEMVYRKRDPLTGEEEELFVPGLFHKAGIPFAIRSDSTQAFGTRYPWYQAARLIRNGIPRQTALEAITVMPARVMGLGDRLGALIPGQDGNVLLLSGDPLDAGTWVEKVIIEGKVVYEKEKDYRLKELLTGEEISGSAGGGDYDSDSKNEE